MEIIAPQNSLFDFIEADPLFRDFHNPVAPPEKAERPGADWLDPVVKRRFTGFRKRCADPSVPRVANKGDSGREFRVSPPRFARKGDNTGLGAPVDSGSRNSKYLFHTGTGLRPQLSASGKDKADCVMRHRGVEVPKEGRRGSNSGGHGN